MRRKLSEGYALAEGPIWSKKIGTLFFVDIEGFKVHSISHDGTKKSYDTGDFVSALALTDMKDMLLIARRDSIAYLHLTDGSVIDLIDLDLPSDTRMNDGKVGPDGAFYVGSMGIDEDRKADGNLYRITYSGYEKLLGGLTIPNGMDWHDGFFYFIDTPSKRIVKYDSNLDAVDSCRIPCGSPDGMTISKKGILYVALWGEGRVAAIDFEKKKEISSFEVDESNCSCPVLGDGKLFVTTGAGKEELGAVYEFDVDDEKKEDRIWHVTERRLW